MRRSIPIAAFALVIALPLALPMWAQHGGSHGGSVGGHAGFSGGHSGGFGGHAGFSGGHMGSGHFSGGMRSGPGFSRGLTRASHSSLSHGAFLHDRFHGNRFRNGRDDRFRHGFRDNCYGYGCWGGYGYPWAYGGYYDPFLWGDSGSSYDEDYERDRATANEMNQQSIEEQQMLRQEQADGDRDSYARSDPAPRPAPGADPQGSAIAPATVLVFHDQHQQEIRNYAIVGQTLWNFAPQRTEKIPLSDLDLSATTKANDDRGLSFRIPISNEAQ